MYALDLKGLSGRAVVGEGITIQLVGDTFISKAGVTSSTFNAIADAPVSSFELTRPTGPYSALAASGDSLQGKARDADGIRWTKWRRKQPDHRDQVGGLLYYYFRFFTPWSGGSARSVSARVAPAGRWPAGSARSSSAGPVCGHPPRHRSRPKPLCPHSQRPASSQTVGDHGQRGVAISKLTSVFRRHPGGVASHIATRGPPAVLSCFLSRSLWAGLVFAWRYRV